MFIPAHIHYVFMHIYIFTHIFMIFTHTFTFIIHIYILSTFTDIKTIMIFESVSTAYSIEYKDHSDKTIDSLSLDQCYFKTTF